MAISTLPLPLHIQLLPIRPSTSSTSSSSLLSPTTTKHHHNNNQPTYIRSGIGGAGNWHKASTIPPPPPPVQPPSTPLHHSHSLHHHGIPTTAPLLPPRSPLRSTTSSSPTQPQKQFFTSGIGGAGNTHPLTQRSALGFDEELARSRAVERQQQRRRLAGAGHHVGIGGAGNFRCRNGGGDGIVSSSSSGSSGNGLGRKRLRAQRSEGALATMKMKVKRSEEGNLRTEAVPRAVVGVEVMGGRGAVGRVSWGECSVEEFDPVGSDGDEEEAEMVRDCVYYSNEPLPYGALDVLRRRLERAFASRSGGAGGKEVLASPKDKGYGAVLVGSEGERRGLRSHRSMWRF